MANAPTKVYRVLGVTLLTITGVASTACSTEPERVEADYGNSVHQMIQASTYNPEAAASTESIPVLGMDGKRAVDVLDAMQEDTQRSDELNDIINIQLSN